MDFFNDKKGLRETYKGMTPEQLVQASQKIDRQNKIAEGPLGLGSGYLGNLIGGGGEMFFGGLGDTARFMNFNGAADTLDKASNYFTERLPEAKPAEFSWNYLTSPEGLARGTGRASGSLASILLPAAVTEGVSLGLTGAGLAARGGALLSRIPGISAKTGKWAAGGLMTVPMESAMEAGNFEKNAIANGMSPSEAAQKSWGVFGRNAGFLGLSNALQFGMLPKIAGAGVSFGRRGLAAGAELGTQAVEEGVQQGIQNEMEGKPYTYNPVEMMSNPKYAEQAQAMKEGFLTMAPIVGAGAVGGAVTDKYRNKNSDDEKSAPNIDEFMQALAGQESGGDYNAYNGMYGAAGKFQILPENWAQWAKDAGLSPNAEMTPENQDIVAKNKMLEYYKKFGDWRKVAEAWYGGEGAVNWSEEAKARPQAGGYPSINEYADSVMARLENIVGKVNSEDDEPEIEITPEMIETANGKYWIEQGGVSYEGAQPQTMQALYALSKWFYEKTGKPLVVTAVTNGNHADGEHSHANGWKIDIHDGGSKGEKKLPHKIKKFAPRDKFLTYNLKFLLPFGKIKMS